MLILLAMLVPACAPKPVAEGPKRFTNYDLGCRSLKKQKKKATGLIMPGGVRNIGKQQPKNLRAKYGIKVNVVMGEVILLIKSYLKQDMAVGTIDVSDSWWMHL